MKDFKHFGIRHRIFPEKNYNAIWNNLKTIRLGSGQAGELPAAESEFYDVSLGNKCSTGKCKFCYVSSNPDGKHYEDICSTWQKLMQTFFENKDGNIIHTNKPFQIAIGSEGEPTEHPEFINFIETVYNTKVVPNYTTNGVILSYWDKPGTKYYVLANKILEATQKYVGGVAISFGNKTLRPYAKSALMALKLKGNTNINIHHIISDNNSVDEFINSWKEYGNDIAYHVLLPLMPCGRSKMGIQPQVFEYLENKIKELDIKNIAFGAHFVDDLKKSKIKTWIYEPESFSKNLLLKKDHIIITPSSFDMRPIKEIQF